MIGRYITIGLLVVGIFMTGRVVAQEVNTEQAAIEAAEAWLQLVDGGEYDQSWEQASEYFRTIMKQQAWKDSIRPLRESLGAVKTRALKTQQYMTALPGAPDGEYVILQFETSFENKAEAIETVTPMVDRDGVWRVSGYYIK